MTKPSREQIRQRLAAIPEFPTVSELAQTAAVMLAGKGGAPSKESLHSEALTHWFASRDELKAHLQKELDQIHDQTEEDVLKRDVARLHAEGKAGESALQANGEPIANFQNGLKRIFGPNGSAGEKEARLRQILIAEYKAISEKSSAPITDAVAADKTAKHMAALKERGFTLVELAAARHLAAEFKSENVRAKNRNNAGKRWRKNG